jgi:hypothetical protein
LCQTAQVKNEEEDAIAHLIFTPDRLDVYNQNGLTLLKDLHVKLLAVCLFVIGIGICYYKVVYFGFPLSPDDQAEIWTVEARVEFTAQGGPTKVQFEIPHVPPGFIVLDEDFVSSKYGLATEQDAVNRQAQWAVRRARDKQALYYRIQLLPSQEVAIPRKPLRPRYPAKPDYAEPERSAVTTLLDHVRGESADIASFTRELLLRLNDPAPEENVLLLRQQDAEPEDWVRTVIRVLAGARIPARMVYVLPLQDGARHGTLQPWLEVHNEQEWITFNPFTAEQGLPSDVLVWYVGDHPMVEISGGRKVKVEFSMTQQTSALLGVAQQRAKVLGSAIIDFSLFSLPLQAQNTYRILLLVPIGAFVMVVLRNLVGVRTFGTFMPILIALAFRETELLWGILMFTGLVAVALMLRLYLEKLRLLLVPRLSAVLIIVIILMAGISVISHKLGLERGLSVALFPMVILTMTIERMSLVWEEKGPGEALLEGLGTLLVAVVGYVVMSSEQLAYMVFVFPELLFALLAVTLLAGRYQGYRLVELWRFRSFLKQGSGA